MRRVSSGPPASPAVIGVAGCCPGQFLAGDVWSSHHLISQGGCNDYIKHKSKPVPLKGGSPVDLGARQTWARDPYVATHLEVTSGATYLEPQFRASNAPFTKH